ncbi:MAG: trypsin-like serine protease, partial [Bdellovibrio sp.]
MKAQKYLLLSGVTAVLALTAACTPAEKFTNSVDNTGAESSSIIGGTAVAADDFVAKSTVFLQAVVRDELMQVKEVGNCTGTLINKQVVLTAAHCVPQAKENESVAIDVLFSPDTQNYTREDLRSAVQVAV